MACNNLGLWYGNSGSPSDACLGGPDTRLYGDSISITEPIYTDSGCANGTGIVSGFYSNNIIWFEYDSTIGLDGEIVDVGYCDQYCIINTGSLDGDYVIDVPYDGYNSYVGPSGFIFFSLAENRWCLAANLGDPCVQFGPFASTSLTPDLDNTVMYNGVCITTTTTTDPCLTLDFDAVFDCLVPVSPSPTPTNTPTPTPTPTPSASNPCGGVSMTVTSSGYTPTPTPTMTPTPTPSPQVTRPCNFSGEVIFNAFSEYLQCGNSKKFKDCFTGIDYYTSDVVLVSGTTLPTEGYVYNSVINGQGYCVIYEGTVDNISGVDNITLTNEIGSYVDGACLDCLPNLTATPTPTPTATPTPTPSQSPCITLSYRISNESPTPIKFDYTNCNGSQSQNLPGFSSIIICASVIPTTTSPNIQIDPLGSTCL
jgi:hypothetical protein